jgi:NTP pyrophosphatase (non-canonical NTP hydrolase)
MRHEAMESPRTNPASDPHVGDSSDCPRAPETPDLSPRDLRRLVDEDCGLSIDMLDADRLREWARLLLVHGADVSHWGSTAFVASKMQTIATGIEKAVRDIGILRSAALPASATERQTEPEGLTFARFAAVNRQRCESPDGFNHALDSWSLSDWFTAVMGELGEAANIAKKLNRVRDGIPGNKETPDALRAKLAKECGDVFVYLDLLCQSVGFNIGDAAVDVFNAKSEDIGCDIHMDRQPAPTERTGAWQPMEADDLRSRLSPPREVVELRAYLDTLIITSDNIGDIRRSLFFPWDSRWNGWVRDETAARENVTLPASPAPAGGKE